jgi:hypothetical protein
MVAMKCENSADILPTLTPTACKLARSFSILNADSAEGPRKVINPAADERAGAGVEVMCGK